MSFCFGGIYFVIVGNFIRFVYVFFFVFDIVEFDLVYFILMLVKIVVFFVLFLIVL